MSDSIVNALVKSGRILNTALTRAFYKTDTKCFFLKRGVETSQLVLVMEVPEGYFLDFPSEAKAPIEAGADAILYLASEKEYFSADDRLLTLFKAIGESTHVAVGQPEKGSYPVYRIADNLIKDDIEPTGLNPESVWYLQREPRLWW